MLHQALHRVDRSGPERALRFIARHPVIFAIWALVAVALLVGLRSFEQREDLAGEHRVEARADTAAGFVESYARNLLDSQAAVARAYLADGQISDAGFERMVKANRFGNAVRLDPSGVVRDAHPRTPGLIGSDIAGRYAHMRRALAGHVAISNVVSSAALGVPVVGVATPFDTTSGRAVLSTGYEVIDSPLTAYLQGAIATASDHVYLVDANDNIVTAKTRAPRRITPLSAREPQLARALGDDATSGTIVEGGERRFFVQRKVAGTPWRFVVAMPVAEAHASRQGDRHRVRAVLMGALAVAALMIAVLVGRLIDANAHLKRDVHRRQEVERELIRDRELLSHQATHDLLTGLPNRTVLLDRLDAALAGPPAHDESVSAVLFVDLDRFKPINDRYGHDTGDVVLREIAERLRAAVRPSDTVSRFGGDEFAVLCESLESRAAAARVAQRIRREIERPIAARGHTVSVGASVGIAFPSGEGVTPTALLADADAAMYEAKGRRAVREG